MQREPVRRPFGPLSCTCTRRHVCEHACVRVCICEHAQACTCVYAQACACVCTCVCMRARTRTCACEGRHPLTLLLLPREPPCCWCLRSVYAYQAASFLLLLHSAFAALSSPPRLLTCCPVTGLEEVSHNSLFVPRRPSRPLPVHAHKNQLILPNASFTRHSCSTYFSACDTPQGGQKRLQNTVM
jgi:hypothetical protein